MVVTGVAASSRGAPAQNSAYGRAAAESCGEGSLRRSLLVVGLVALVAIVVTLAPRAQRNVARRAAEPALTVDEYTPRSTLVVDEDPVARARFPVVDVHSHHRPGFSAARWAGIVAEMDALNLQVLVNLSGGWGSGLQRGLDTIAGSPHPDRMVFFANLDFRGGVGPGFGARSSSRTWRPERWA